MTKLPPPTNQKAYILKALITGKSTNERHFSINGFRSRISELINEDGVNIQFKPVAFKNRFKHTAVYRERYIPEKSKAKAVRIYNQVNGAA